MQDHGQLKQTDFMDNVGGLNLADSLFKVTDGQVVGGINYDYTLTGGFQKRLGSAKINTVADAQLKSIGLGLYNSAASVKRLIRAAGTKLQVVDTSVPSFTDLSDDTVSAGTTPLSSTISVSFSQFNNAAADILWSIGGGQTIPNGVYSATKYTQNGVPVPTMTTFTATAVGSGGSLQSGVYRYALAYRKASTQALSNVGGEAVVTCTTSDSVNLAWTFSNNDTTRFDAIYVYRSALNGATEFTTGDLITTLSISATTYTDTGTSIASSENIPRAGNVLLDNSVLESGAYKAMTVFKRRLVVAKSSTIYLSDVNKSESFPTVNTITVPSGGAITALAVISFTAPQANTLDEILVIFKEREVWVVTGDTYEDFTLKFITSVGCAAQNLVVTCSGFIAWVDYRGVYIWDGTSKPIYCSRLVEPLFAKDGDLTKSLLPFGCGQFYQRNNQVIWYLSSRLYGEQKYALKLDLRLTLPQISQDLTGRQIDGVFMPDSYTSPIYSALSYLSSSSSDEFLMTGDDAGFLYNAYNAFADGGSDYTFQYKTKPLNMGNPNVMKQFYRVIAWVQNFGNWDLYLDYWSNYRVGANYMSTRAQPLSTSDGNGTALWDVALWDVALWDDYDASIVPVVFHLDAGIFNSNQGTALQLQFRNETANQPIIVHAFSVIWGEISGLIN